MAINLASKYSKQIDQIYTHESFVAGKSSGKYEFNGAKSVKIYSPTTVQMNDYSRNGANRYGTPQEMQDEIQELIVTQDKSFALTIDKGNASEQMGTKNAGERLRQQMNERTIPTQDKYALGRYVFCAGTVKGIAPPTAETILRNLTDARVEMNNGLVPQDQRYCFMGSTYVGELTMAKQIVELQGLGTKAIEKGVVGKTRGFLIVEVPDDYLPADCYFLCFRSDSVANPHKINDTNLHINPPGISGHLMEGRFVYDAFVLGKKCNGVYAAVATAKKQTTPTITVANNSATIVSAGASKILYTIDGSDPRYSGTAEVYSSAVAVTAKDVIKAVAYGTFTSDVAEKTV